MNHLYFLGNLFGISKANMNKDKAAIFSVPSNFDGYTMHLLCI